MNDTDAAYEIPPYESPRATQDRHGRPVGYLTVSGRTPKHRCAPPVLRDPNESAAGDVGAVWRCPCGTLWTVYQLTQTGPGQRIASPFDRRWKRAGWLVRWRYRNAESVEPDDLLPGLIVRPGRRR